MVTRFLRVFRRSDFASSDMKTWQRPTLPRLETEYHWRGGFSRPSSGWDRVWTPRYGHQVVGSDDIGGRHRRMTEVLVLCEALLWEGECLQVASRGVRPHARDLDQAERAISTSRLSVLPRLHPWPIDVMVYHGSSGRPGFEGGFPLRCLQRLSRPHLATRRCRWRDNRYTRGAFIPVLSY